MGWRRESSPKRSPITVQATVSNIGILPISLPCGGCLQLTQCHATHI